MKLYEYAVIIITQMINSDQIGTQHKSIYKEFVKKLCRNFPTTLD